jgi:ADP-ribose pyrophosphatase
VCRQPSLSAASIQRMDDHRDGKREVLFEGDWLRLVRRGHWESCERTHGKGMAVIIVAATPDDDVLFVEQYRVPLGSKTIEMPAGLVGDQSDDDTLEAAAIRELEEETGWKPGRVRVLLIGPTSAGMSNERIAFVRAEQLVRTGEGGGVDGENIVVHAVPRNEAPAWLLRKQAEGYELDLKLWAGLWMLEREPDGTPR